MSAWVKLNQEENDRAWNAFYFKFHPGGTDPRGTLDFREPTPSITWDISDAWKDPDPLLQATHTALNQAALSAFRRCTGTDDRLFAFDVQHYYYGFYPHRAPDNTDSDPWMVSMLPDGDFRIFLAEDLSFGTYGHPRDSTICVFGQALLDAFEGARPTLFHKMVRKDGEAV